MRVWAQNKTLRNLLGTLPDIWAEAADDGGTEAPLFPRDLYAVTVHDEAVVKRAYLAALRMVHPDKVAAAEQQRPAEEEGGEEEEELSRMRRSVLARQVFERLQGGYQLFKAQPPGLR